METQQQPALVQIDDWHIPDLTYEAEEELTTEGPAQIILDSPPYTIPFDEDSPPRQLPSERLIPSEKIGEVAGSPSPVIERSDDEKDNHTRLRHQNKHRRPDYTYQDYQDTIEHAISAPPLRKWKREDSDAVDFQSKIVRSSCLSFSILANNHQKKFVKEVTELYETLEKENRQLTQERHQ